MVYAIFFLGGGGGGGQTVYYEVFENREQGKENSFISQLFKGHWYCSKS